MMYIGKSYWKAFFDILRISRARNTETTYEITKNLKLRYQIIL